jgi:diphosphomevalonate decarboxylase
VTVAAVAHPNIALAKYWGKLGGAVNLPAVPSLSVTLAGMTTLTRVSVDDALAADRFELDGREASGRPLERVSAMLDALWARAGRSAARPRAEVVSANDFPTAAGLASSASAFAALAVAGDAALATGLTTASLSSLARSISASAGRSLYGGFVVLPAGRHGHPDLAAEPLADPHHWDLRLIVAVTTEDAKEVGSTEGMNHTAASSVLYPAWVEAAPAIFDRVREAVLARDLEGLGTAVEQSTLAMHASALAADPGVIYWNGTTVEVMRFVRRIRRRGTPAFFTMDAGPHVKVVTTRSHVPALVEALSAVPGVLRCIVAEPGEGARVVAPDAPPAGANGR